jgi:DNA modification methylase
MDDFGTTVDMPFPTLPQLVLDPFIGSGTTALVARKHGRRCIGIDLSAEYLAIAAKRTQQLSLLGGAA